MEVDPKGMRPRENSRKGADLNSMTLRKDFPDFADLRT